MEVCDNLPNTSVVLSLQQAVGVPGLKTACVTNNGVQLVLRQSLLQWRMSGFIWELGRSTAVPIRGVIG